MSKRLDCKKKKKNAKKFGHSRDDEEPTLDSITGAVQVRDNLTLASLHVGGGGQALKGRTWQGLDPNMNPPSATGTVVEGRKGIAAGYQDETPAES